LQSSAVVRMMAVLAFGVLAFVIVLSYMFSVKPQPKRVEPVRAAPLRIVAA